MFYHSYLQILLQYLKSRYEIALSSNYNVKTLSALTNWTSNYTPNILQMLSEQNQSDWQT